MRKTSLALLAALTLPLFTACDDDEKSTAAPAPAPTTTLTAQDKQMVAQSTAMLTGFVGQGGMVSGITESVTSMATDLAASFAPLPGRALGASCPSFDTTMDMGDMSFTIRVTKADGSDFASCSEAQSSYATAGLGMKIRMVMNSTQEGMTTKMTMNYSVVFKPVVATGGYTITLNMDMDMSMVGQGQTVTMSISPMTATVTAASKDAEPTLLGSMTLTLNGYTISGLKFTESGVPAQTVDLLKAGSKIGTIVVDANGQATAFDNSGNPIR